MTLPRIVILGAGLSGTLAAYELREKLKNRVEVTLVGNSEEPFYEKLALHLLGVRKLRSAQRKAA